ncbi:SRPBCC family protein [Amycolatopsis cynarae]|uniref:SRPBCC family protein n=1 Tax=Amycolatopsis cynarae TaxID=2995223 RepID=A0ABY7AWC9_9PSEU|nr:SRPBCC family protein [Amycolatopsis sp. HUAS 11-8]WAL63232.1 SRPBCC family protein [Amycolatopsis sp. HUAS 11-8]
MAEFERERAMPAPAEEVYAAASDAELFDQWLPGNITVRPTRPPAVTAEVNHHPEPGVLGESPDQLRLEWGLRGSDEYSGWLQVASAEQGRSHATLHLSFHGDHPANHGGQAAEEVDRQLDETLARLARVVAHT